MIQAAPKNMNSPDTAVLDDCSACVDENHDGEDLCEMDGCSVYRKVQFASSDGSVLTRLNV